MVYVDKTALVYNLAQKNICFLCRLRRFGKSLLISTLEIYFKGERELFKGLKIDELEKDGTQYSVFRMDFAQGGYGVEGDLKRDIGKRLTQWEHQLGIEKQIDKSGSRFSDILAEAHRQTGRKWLVRKYSPTPSRTTCLN